MRELALHCSLPTKRGPLSVFRATETQGWERQSNGDFVIRLDGDTEHEFLVPAAQVKYERRSREKKK